MHTDKDRQTPLAGWSLLVQTHCPAQQQKYPWHTLQTWPWAGREDPDLTPWGPWSRKPAVTRVPSHALHGPLCCPESITYPTDVVNLPACGGAQGGHLLPAEPGQLLLREGTLEEMGPEGHSWGATKQISITHRALGDGSARRGGHVPG